MRIKLPLTLALIALCSASVNAQQNKWTSRVSVDVSAKDEIKNEIISYAGRELRSLGDIVIVESKPNYRISIVAITTHNQANQETGYALSVTATELNTED